MVALWVLLSWIAGKTIEGWASLMIVFLLVSSFQTLALGVIGEYIGKIYLETKRRPPYLIEASLPETSDEQPTPTEKKSC